MKFKLFELKNMEKSLGNLLMKELNIKLSYRLGKFLKKVNEEFNELEMSRVKLVKKYGKHEENSDKYEVLPENINNFSNEYNQLLDEEIQIDIEPICLEELGDIKLSPVDMMLLERIIIEPIITVDSEEEPE